MAGPQIYDGSIGLSGANLTDGQLVLELSFRYQVYVMSLCAWMSMDRRQVAFSVSEQYPFRLTIDRDESRRFMD